MHEIVRNNVTRAVSGEQVALSYRWIALCTAAITLSAELFPSQACTLPLRTGWCLCASDAERLQTSVCSGGV